jgi:hypothetical protein
LADLKEPLELFAIGGTAMVLNGIKDSTKDIDFLTIEKQEKIRKLFKLAGLKEESPDRICNIWRLAKTRVDIFYDGFILGIPFPDDWRELSKKINDYLNEVILPTRNGPALKKEKINLIICTSNYFLIVRCK